MQPGQHLQGRSSRVGAGSEPPGTPTAQSLIGTGHPGSAGTQGQHTPVGVMQQPQGGGDKPVSGSVRAAKQAQRARLARIERFSPMSAPGNLGAGAGPAAAAGMPGEVGDWAPAHHKVVGVCQKLEKSYFRLSGVPDPRDVRPPTVLAKASARLVNMVRAGDARATDFYVNDQFKGIRQDLTVQGVRTEVAVDSYEAHGRFALEYGDVTGEYNQ